jgi:hypothetical protein
MLDSAQSHASSRCTPPTRYALSTLLVVCTQSACLNIENVLKSVAEDEHAACDSAEGSICVLVVPTQNLLSEISAIPNTVGNPSTIDDVRDDIERQLTLAMEASTLSAASPAGFSFEVVVATGASSWEMSDGSGATPSHALLLPSPPPPLVGLYYYEALMQGALDHTNLRSLQEEAGSDFTLMLTGIVPNLPAPAINYKGKIFNGATQGSWEFSNGVNIGADHPREAIVSVSWAQDSSRTLVAHEVGHMLGAKHDSTTDPACVVSGRPSCGWLPSPSSSNSFTSVMSYPSSCQSGITCVRQVVFSNPGTFLGGPIGNSLTMNNWCVVRGFAAYVSRYSDAPGPASGGHPNNWYINTSEDSVPAGLCQ